MTSQLTPEQVAKLTDLVRRLRMVAMEGGVQTVMWDAIFDIEAKLGRGRPRFHEEAEQTIDLAERLLRRARTPAVQCRRPDREGTTAYNRSAP